MSEARAENPASGKVANPKVMLNLGSLPPRQKPSAMMREQVSVERAWFGEVMGISDFESSS